jgi:hypothetical protein
VRNASLSLRRKQLVTEFLIAENAFPNEINRKMKGLMERNVHTAVKFKSFCVCWEIQDFFYAL